MGGKEEREGETQGAGSRDKEGESYGERETKGVENGTEEGGGCGMEQSEREVGEAERRGIARMMLSS